MPGSRSTGRASIGQRLRAFRGENGLKLFVQALRQGSAELLAARSVDRRHRPDADQLDVGPAQRVDPLQQIRRARVVDAGEDLRAAPQCIIARAPSRWSRALLW